jgi:hypothetical protein
MRNSKMEQCMNPKSKGWLTKPQVENPHESINTQYGSPSRLHVPS